MKDLTKNNQLVQDFIEAAKSVGMKEPENRTVGNNGYTLGQQFHTTGLEVVEAEISGSKNKAVYVAVTTEEGVNLSLKSLMGISSLNGYETEGTFENESRENGKKVVSAVTAEVIEGFNFDMVFQPSCRQFLDFIAECEESDFFVGKVVTYLGKVVKPYVAKSKSKDTSFETYKEGDKRTITAKLWSVE